MNKIRVIDLLNKIANGEEAPRQIIYENKKYVLHMNNEYYSDTETNGLFASIFGSNYINNKLNNKVEIIEESEQDIDIQDIVMMDLEKYGFDNKDEFAIDLIFKINELVQAVKKLDNKIKEK